MSIQTDQPTLALVPEFAGRRQKIRDEELVPADKEALRFKRDGSICNQHGIHGGDEAATRARNWTVSQAAGFLTEESPLDTTTSSCTWRSIQASPTRSQVILQARDWHSRDCCDSHFFLVDDLQQMASTVDSRMKRLVKRLRHGNILREGGMVLGEHRKLCKAAQNVQQQSGS